MPARWRGLGRRRTGIGGGEGGGIVGETSAEVVERVERGELKRRGRGRGKKKGSREVGVIFILPPFSFLFSGTFFSPLFLLFSSSFLSLSLSLSSPSTPAVLSTIRYISGHPRHCFRGISSELFARDSFRASTSLAVPIPLLFLFLSFPFHLCRECRGYRVRETALSSST